MPRLKPSSRLGQSTARNVLVAAVIVGSIIFRAYSGSQPQKLHSDVMELESGAFGFYEFELYADSMVMIEAELLSGPPLEFVCLDMTNYGMYKRMMDSGQLDKKLSPIMELTEPNLDGKKATKWHRLPKGKWAVVFDNTIFGRISPPLLGGASKVSMKIMTKKA